MTGCSVCEEEIPRVEQWALGHITDFAFVKVNVSSVAWRPEGTRNVKATPSFSMMRGSEELAFHEGAFGEQSSFSKFVKGALP